MLMISAHAAPTDLGLARRYTNEPLSLICTVSVQKSAIRLEVGEHVPVGAFKIMAPGFRTLTVLGRPAILETMRVGSLSATTLTVARDVADEGDFAAITVVTPDRPADEATMVHLAELILSHIAGWTL